MAGANLPTSFDQSLQIAQNRIDGHNQILKTRDKISSNSLHAATAAEAEAAVLTMLHPFLKPTQRQIQKLHACNGSSIAAVAAAIYYDSSRRLITFYWFLLF